MVKLDVSCMRNMSKNDYRVLTAVEMGMKNHDVVPVELITSIAKLRHGGAQKIIATLATYKLIAHDRSVYDGYRLTYQGYDILALRAMLSRGSIRAVGTKIGVGKESDVYVAETLEGEEVVLKLHRLGRTSFRAVKSKRDYLRHRSSAGWLYMSRLSAMKEFAFMRALYDSGFPTPVPLDHSRHAVLMSMASGYPLYQIRRGELPDPAPVYAQIAEIVRRLALHGLVHCDLNEFNVIVDHAGAKVTVIDFPQMVSTRHANAADLFRRDVDGVLKFFRMKLGYAPPEDLIPRFETSMTAASAEGGSSGGTGSDGSVPRRLDLTVRASGFGGEEERDFEEMMAEQQRRGPPSESGSESGGGSAAGSDEEDEEEEEAAAEVDERNLDSNALGLRRAGEAEELGPTCAPGEAGGRLFVELDSSELHNGQRGRGLSASHGGESGEDERSLGDHESDGGSSEGDTAAQELHERQSQAGLEAKAMGETARRRGEGTGLEERASRLRRQHKHGGTEGKGTRNVQKMRVRGKKLYRGTDF